MPFVLEHNVVFFHIPKTGGTWVRNLLRDTGLLLAQRGHKHDPPGIDRYLPAVSEDELQAELERRRGGGPNPNERSFCFVRHPLTWYESWFRYMSAPEKAWKPWRQEHTLLAYHPCAVLDGLGADRFEEFVENVLTHRPGFVTELYFSFTAHITVVGRFETLRESLVESLEACGIRTSEIQSEIADRPPQNVAPTSPIVWDGPLRQEVCAVEYAAMRRFGYEA